MNWPLAQAKDQLSEVVRRARSIGPQTISIRGKEEAVVISKAEFDALRDRRGEDGNERWKGAKTLKELLLTGPSWDGVNLERRDAGHREIDL